MKSRRLFVLRSSHRPEGPVRANRLSSANRYRSANTLLNGTIKGAARLLYEGYFDFNRDGKEKLYISTLFYFLKEFELEKLSGLCSGGKT